MLGHYRKMHIPDDPLYYEKFYFTPGDLGSAPSTRGSAGWASWSAGTSGIPEAARLTALQGREILFYPTAIGWHPDEKAEFGAAQHDAWETIQRSHAIANGVFVAAREPGRQRRGRRGLEFWGGSSSPIPSAACSPRPATTGRRS